jgi:hypothetical protein
MEDSRHNEAGMDNQMALEAEEEDGDILDGYLAYDMSEF